MNGKMSVPPDPNKDIVIAIRATSAQLKKDLKEAEKDFDMFQKQLEDKFAEMAQIQGDKAPSEVSPLQSLKLDKLGQESKLLMKTSKIREKEVNTLKKSLLMMRMIATNQKVSGKLSAQESKVLLNNKQYLEEMNKILRKKLTLEAKAAAQKEKALEKERKKQKKLQDEEEKRRTEANKTWFTRLKERMRLYSVFSKDGVRMITTMRGAAGVALGIIAGAAQVFAQQILQGLRHIMKYEEIARNIAFIQAGTTGESLSSAYNVAFSAYTTPGGTQWGEAGIPRVEGAGLDILNLKSGLEFSKEQMITIATLSKFINEESDSFMRNLVGYIKIFGIEKEAFDDTINSFALLSGMSMGGSGELTQGLDYLAGLGKQAGWDPMQFLTIQKEVIAQGRDSSRFWRQLNTIIQKVIDSDANLVEGIRHADKSLRSFDQILWILDESYDEHEGYIDSASWALGEFGAKGVEAFEALGLFVDDIHELNTLDAEGIDLRNKANDAQDETADILKNSVGAKLIDLSESIEDFQMALANLLAGPLKDFMVAGTDILDTVSIGIEESQRILEGRETQESAITEWARRQGMTTEQQDIWAEQGKREGDLDLGMLADILLSPFTGTSGKSERAKWFERKEDEELADYNARIFNQFCRDNPDSPYCADYDVLGLPGGEAPDFDFQPEASPAIRGRGGSTQNINRTSSSSNVTHNYITIMDNDSMLRGLLGVNINV
jgi:hypothetical protein